MKLLGLDHYEYGMRMLFSIKDYIVSRRNKFPVDFEIVNCLFWKAYFCFCLKLEQVLTGVAVQRGTSIHLSESGNLERTNDRSWAYKY